MRKTSIAGVVLTCGTIIALGWQMGAQGDQKDFTAATDSSTTATTDAVKNSQQPQAASTPEAAAPSAASAATAQAAPVQQSAASATSETITGDSISTRYGDVQVSVKFNGSTIEDITALKLTDADRKSVSISNRAAPMLRASVLKSQSAQVSTVSGATYTSDAYLESLQSAIDKHHA